MSMAENIEVTPETLLAEWDEPTREATKAPARLKLLIIVASLVVAAGLVGIAIWQHQFSFYLGAAAALVGGFALINQDRRPDVPQHIVLTTTRVIVGKSEHLLIDLAGFWMDSESGYLVINIESKKRQFLPISFFFSSNDYEDALHTLTQALPEIEPPAQHLSDNINRYFRS